MKFGRSSRRSQIISASPGVFGTVLFMVLCTAAISGCREASPGDSANAGVDGWVAQGPRAWAEHLAPKAASNEDGFPSLIQLSSWLTSVSIPAEEEPVQSLDWAKEYSDMVTAIAERSRWSGRILVDEDLKAMYGDKVAKGITDGQSQISNSGLIEVGKAAKSALWVLQEHGEDELAERLALRVFALVERLGRSGGHQDQAIAALQISMGAGAAESLATIARERGDAEGERRYRDIRAGIEEYGKRHMQRLRGGP